MSEAHRELRRLAEKAGLTLGASELAAEIPHWLDLGEQLNLIFGAPGRGLPGGKILELYGGESHGKTALLLHLLGLNQALGGFSVLADIEGSYHPDWASKLGVDTKLLCRLGLGLRPKNPKAANPKTFVPEGMEDLFGKLGALIEAKKELWPDSFCLIGWDSIASTCTRAELEGDFGDSAFASQARVLSKELRKLVSLLKEASNVSLVCTNQLRSKIGYITYDDTPGGRALKFYSTCRISVRRLSKPTNDVQKIRIRCEKNRVAWPRAEVEAWISRESGILWRDPSARKGKK